MRLESSGVKQKQKDLNEETCVIIVSGSMLAQTETRDQSGKLLMNELVLVLSA